MKPSPTTSSGLTVIGLGASAGGLTALQQFFSAMPSDTGLAFVVVIHLSAEHESHLAEILQHSTSMPVVQVTETLKIQPERERYLEFVRTPAFPNPVAVFVDRKRAFIFSQWSDLTQHKGGISLGNTFGAEFSQYAASHLRLEESGTADTNFQKLGLGRIDYFVVGLFTGETYLARHGLGDRFMAMRPFLTEDKNYFAFAKSSSCVKYHDAFEARLKELVANKTNIAMLGASLQGMDIKLDVTSLSRK